MKLHPPTLSIDEKAPFKDALFGRKEFAESLTALLRRVQEGVVVFVHAPWGEGKTTFSRMWRASLHSQKLEVIYFDAYAADYFEDPFLSFSGEIVGLIDKRIAAAKGVPESRREFTKTAVEVGKRLAGLSARVGLRALTMGAVESAHLGELKDIGAELATGAAGVGADLIEKRIENYATEKDSLQAFRKNLAELAAIVKAEQGFPLTIIVDELDRCRPDFALGLLERIKHLFDVDGVAFVLLVNRDQIESYIRTVYGQSVDASAYLLKFANLFVDLPTKQTRYREEGSRHEFCRKLFEHYQLPVPNDEGDILGRSVRLFTVHFDLTLREIERSFTLLALYYGSLPQNHLSHGLLVALLSVLKVKQPGLYRALANRSTSVVAFLKESRLDQLANDHGNGVDREWLMDLINFCLMSDAEIDAVPQGQGPQRMGQWLVRYSLDRQQVIPLLAERIDRFSLQPA